MERPDERDEAAQIVRVMKSSKLLVFAIALLTGTFRSGSFAQNYPTKPVDTS
jgi:hypothetical protein